MNVSRRAVVTAIPAFAIPVGSIDASPHEDVALIRTWKELEAHTKAWERLPDATPDEIFDQFADRYCALRDVLISTPAHSLSGLAAKFRGLMLSEYDGCEGTSIWNSVATDFERLARMS